MLRHLRVALLLSEQEKKSRLDGPEPRLKEVLRNVHSTWWIARAIFFLLESNKKHGICHDYEEPDEHVSLCLPRCAEDG